MIREYFDDVNELLANCPLAVSFQFDFTVIDIDRGYWKSEVIFRDGYELHPFEYVITKHNELLIEDYRYHFQDPGDKVIFRFDNAPHHPEVESHPHHLHQPDGIFPSTKPQLEEVLDRAINRIIQ